MISTNEALLGRTNLEQRAGQLLEGAGEVRALNGVVQAHNGHILLAGILLRLDEPRGALDAHNQTSRHLMTFVTILRQSWLIRHLGVKCAAVTGLLNTQDALDPGDNLKGGIGCNLKTKGG